MSRYSREYSPNYKRKKYEKNSPSTSKPNESDFSFLHHKYVLEKLIEGFYPTDKLIDDIPDFWMFVKKYELMIKKSGKTFPKYNEENNLESKHKRQCIFLDIESDVKRYHENVINQDKRSDLTEYRISRFYDIIILYLDFKQKEKFTRLEKLRDCQKNLPVCSYKKDILEAVNNNQVTIIAGDTGCGKSTQIPQYLYQSGYKNIVCTQPRRLACIALSKRVAHEMLSEFSSKVGYQIRFERNKNKDTDICFITEGLLLRQLAANSELDQYDVIILDEIHERNLHGDFLLGVAKCLLRSRPTLKLILMSATINVGLFKNFFNEENTALIEVPGRLFPIKTYYMPTMKTDLNPSRRTKDERLNPEPYIQIMNLIDQKYPQYEKGDMLIFVSGVNEIETVMDAAKEYSESQNHWIILPLHSGLSLSDQDKVFDYAPDGMRKCIVSTNIAETSVTVDGVRFVVDSGKMKEMTYDSTCKMRKLKEFWVSKSSAEQRKGRAGRTGPGICYRIFSEKEFDEFNPYSTPEICRVPLDSMLLQMVSMGLPNVRLFPFIESPSKESLEQAILALKQHGAIGADEKISTLGNALSMLPVEISIGKMLLMGSVFQELQRVLTLCAALSIQSPFTNRAFKDQKCELARRSLESDQGDPITLLNTYREWLERKWKKNDNTKKWCHEMGLEEQRFYELTKLRNQFERILENCNLLQQDPDDVSSAERSLRNGEMRTLRAMRRAHKMDAPKKRKIIKYNQSEGEDFNEKGDDIRDVEFRLSNDKRKLDNLLSSATIYSHRDTLMLKLILVSGLYPQIAIPDEFNYCKSGSQQLFHTFLKPFVSIHPNGQLAHMTDILKLTESDFCDKPHYYTSRLHLSSAHQILCYQNLLETTKPYLLNVIRMAAAQTLLLFSLTIDTNATMSKLVCDSWLCLEFPFPESGQNILSRAIKLRHTWQKLLSEKLLDPKEKLSDTKVHHRQTEFLDDLIKFLKMDVIYTIKRLLNADLKNIYTNYSPELCPLPLNPFDESFEMLPNSTKGGFNITENVVYACLREDAWCLALEEEISKMEWTCDNCGNDVPLFGINKLIHKIDCKSAVKNELKEEEEEIVHRSSSKNVKKYECDVCKEILYMTSIEVLKHKRSCKIKDVQS